MWVRDKYGNVLGVMNILSKWLSTSYYEPVGGNELEYHLLKVPVKVQVDL